jgi:hypothetical protein
MQYDEKQILKSVPQHVKSLFAKSTRAPVFYHNLEHTRSVVSELRKMGGYYHLKKKDIILLQTAAWYRDIGWNYDSEHPEAAAAELMLAYLAEKNLDPELISKIAGLIMTTKMPQHPSGLLEEISCDCHFFHASKRSFYKKCKLWQREAELAGKESISRVDWLTNMIRLLETHQYFSEYGRTYLEQGKQRNLLKLKQKLIAAEKELGRPDKGIETMFRITSSNNQRLSDMADQKAHLLITVNSIILSAIISLILRRLDKYGYLLYPTAFLLAVCLAAMTLAILTTRPSIPVGKFDEDDLKTKKVNLLFFGNFYKMSLNEYLEGMLKVMNDNGFLYRTLIMDVYGQGVVLGKKYGFLRTAYSIFMFGLILAVLGFITAMLFHNG